MEPLFDKDDEKILFIAALGARNSGKTTIWKKLFRAPVQRGPKDLELICGNWVKCFLFGPSNEETGRIPSETFDKKPQNVRIILGSVQSVYPNTTFDEAIRRGYETHVFWIEPGYNMQGVGIHPQLLNHLIDNQITVQNLNAFHGVEFIEKLIRERIFGWARIRRLV